jgi:hypothetical protein
MALHRRFTLHTGGRDKLDLTIFFGFDGADARSFRIAFFHISKRAADLTHPAATALLGINNNNVAHLPASMSRTHPKNASNAQQLRYRPPQNAHILSCMLRFFVGRCLAVERDLQFLR